MTTTNQITATSENNSTAGTINNTVTASNDMQHYDFYWDCLFKNVSFFEKEVEKRSWLLQIENFDNFTANFENLKKAKAELKSARQRATAYFNKYRYQIE